MAAYAEDLQTSPKQGIKVNYLVHNSKGICAWKKKKLSSVSMEMAILGTHHGWASGNGRHAAFPSLSVIHIYGADLHVISPEITENWVALQKNIYWAKRFAHLLPVRKTAGEKNVR